ncbi:MAG: hypothetical protein GF346_02610, partial [Candidatus Eisenbacteria bacterium]|nr:hypothetical protein [Candidatus Latescibacterota bacterium]MBD3301312.1 hypothetical protein [Candidatus Eisenbacteria bacterium]
METIDLRERIAELTSAPFQEGDPEPFADLDRLLDTAEESRQLQGLAEISGEALSQQPLDPARYYLHSFGLVRLGKPDAAVKPLIALCGKLEQGKQWDLLGKLLPRVLEEAPSVDAARSLAKVGETIGVEKIDAETLTRAYDQYPDEERLAYLMGDLAAAQDRQEEALGYWAESLDGFVNLKRWERLEEAILKVADSEKAEHQRHVLNVIHRLAEQGQWGRFASFLDLSLPGLRKADLMPDLWKIILHFAPKMPKEADPRKWIRTLAPEAYPAAEGILDLLSRSGVLDPQIRIEASIKQLETLLEFAPGFHVLHASWGVGKVRLNDGDTIVVDFPETKNHRMKLTLARRALTVLPPDDLRVLQTEDPAQLKRFVRSEPGEVIVRSLRMLRGEATTQELRRSLTGQRMVSASGWSAWWKEARAAIESDDRVDLSQSFRQVYRLRGDTADEDTLLPLPVIEPRRGIRPNLNLIRRFLDQHPDETARAARTYTPIIERWARDEKTSAEDRLAVHLQLFRWRREVREDFLEALHACLDARVEMSAFGDPEDQKLLARVATELPERWKEGALFVLSSRSAEVREVALARLRQNPEEARSAINELLNDPAPRALAALSVIAIALEDPPEPFADDPWMAALGAVLLVDATTKEPIRKQALGWLSRSGRLVGRLRSVPIAEDRRDRWVTVLRRWRSSERFLQPVLDFLADAGWDAVVDEVRSAHAARTDRALGVGADGASADYQRGHLMTRATYQKLLHERNQLVWELKNTIPEAIRKARELGDLRENAEYDAAKHKQADYAHRAGELSRRLSEARKIEDLTPPPGEAAPGTQVVVTDATTNEEKVFWILGEGDDWHGPDVVSYATPLGRKFLGKRIGDRVRIVGADVVHDYVIRGVERRLPVAPEDADEIEVTEEDLRRIAEIE